MRNNNILFFLIITITLFNSCSKDDDYEQAPPPTNTSITINSPAQFNCTIDGATFSAKENVSDYMSLSLHIEHDNGVNLEHSYIAFISSLQDSLPLLDIYNGKLFTSSGAPSDQSVLNFYAPGDYPFADSTNNGIGISFSSDGVDSWSSDFGDQSGSHFHIDDSRIELDQQLQENFVKVKATINCKLYDLNGQNKTMTSCVVVFKVYPNL